MYKKGDKMKQLIPMLCAILTLVSCSKQKMEFTTPQNATVILLCSSVLQTNDEVQIAYRLDEVIKGSLDPKFIDEFKIIKGFKFPTIENENIPEKTFIFGRPKAEPKGTDWFRLEYQYSGISVYDETLLEHKNDIQYLQAEFDRQMSSINFSNEQELQRAFESNSEISKVIDEYEASKSAEETK
jgi:hypothetical protein